MNYREGLKDKKRIVVKIGSSSLQHPQTGDLDYMKLEKLVRQLCDIRNQGKDVILVTSGAIAVGKKAVSISGHTPNAETPLAFKQACAAVGQARLMMTYQKIFAEYNQIVAQILMTKNTFVVITIVLMLIILFLNCFLWASSRLLMKMIRLLLTKLM